MTTTTSLENLKRELKDYIKYHAKYGEEMSFSPDSASDILDILMTLRVDPRNKPAIDDWYQSIEQGF